MRQFIFIIGVLVIFTSLARLVWVESEILAEAYEIQRLRQLDGQNGNESNMYRVAIAKRFSQRNTEELAGAFDLSLGAVRVVPRSVVRGIEAAH